MSPKYLVAVAVLMASASPLRAQSVKAGIEAWQKADYSSAVAIWRPLAEHGDADAEFNLGQAYRLGRGVPIDLSTAKSWFERAAAQGHLDAQTTLGLLLFQNGEQTEGLSWLKKAAAEGEPRALLVYGTALINGDSVTQNPVLGYAYISRAAAQGLGPAKDTLQQLDQILPLAQRQRGVALARTLAKAAPAPKSKVEVAAKQVRPAKPAPAPAVAKATQAKVPPKPAPAVAGVANGAWRIQLGAFSQRGSAEALFQKLSAKPPLAARHAFYIPVGSITRLQAGPFESKGAAEAACRSLGVPCFAVPAK